MKMVRDVHRNARMLLRGLMRAGASRRDRVKPRSIGALFRAWLISGDEGQALVETTFALLFVLPIFLGVLVFGVYEAQMFTLAEAVDNSARALAASRGGDPCAAASTALLNSAPSNLIQTSNLTYTFTINGAATANNTTTCASETLNQGAQAAVTANYESIACSLGIPNWSWLPGSCTITETVYEVVQ